jgi:hypothetical protein
MTTLRDHPYWGIARVELHEARRRAHSERAEVVRQLLRAMLPWRGSILNRAEPREGALQLVQGHQV